MKLPDVFNSCDEVKEWITQQFNTLQVCYMHASCMTGSKQVSKQTLLSTVHAVFIRFWG